MNDHKPKCQHPRPVVHEEVTGESVWYFEGGEIVADTCGSEGPTGIYVVVCRDCGFHKRFLLGGRMPKWVRVLIAKVGKT